MKDIKFNLEYNKIRKNGKRYAFGKTHNLLVDDGKEYILDGLAGIKFWSNPTATESGATKLGTFTRFGGVGVCMFNNSSTERVDGINGITGSGCSYPILTTELVSPEDSTLSRETGTRAWLTATRRDQTVEFVGRFTVPGDIASGAQIREFGLFLKQTGPLGDPSFNDVFKPSTMLCRAALFGTGVCGGTGVYIDEPLIANDDIEFRWKVGEL